MFQTSPAVFAVGKEYQIMIHVDYEAIMWVRVGDKTYYDSSNGIMRSHTIVHRVSVPMEELNSAKRYTVYLRRVIDRKPYFPVTAEAEEQEYVFRPVPGEHVRAYHIADTHNHVEEPVKAAKAYGEIDFLILNGDIPNHSGEEKNIITVYQLVSEITHGNIPTVFSRGNHDTRGKLAEKFADLTPCLNGCSYYTFRLGTIWGLILDCGEDKLDTNDEYGHMVCCHDFRERETQFIKQVIMRAEEEYADPEVTHRIVITHIPFTRRFVDIFDIEQEIYAQWTAMLREHIKPHTILCGHTHKLAIYECGTEMDAYGQPCPVVVGSEPVLNQQPISYAGVGLAFSPKGIEVTFTDNTGAQRGTYNIGL